MTPQMALIPNHGELGGVATEYRRVYQNIAFSPGKTWFSTDQRHERRTHFSPHRVNENSTTNQPQTRNRSDSILTLFGLYWGPMWGPKLL